MIGNRIQFPYRQDRQIKQPSHRTVVPAPDQKLGVEQTPRARTPVEVIDVHHVVRSEVNAENVTRKEEKPSDQQEREAELSQGGQGSIVAAGKCRSGAAHD